MNENDSASMLRAIFERRAVFERRLFKHGLISNLSIAPEF